jgi:hypothetical protein
MGEVRREHLMQFLIVRGAQVDFVVGAVQAEPDRALGRAAVDVVDKQSLDLLDHMRSPDQLSLKD